MLHIEYCEKNLEINVKGKRLTTKHFQGLLEFIISELN